MQIEVKYLTYIRDLTRTNSEIIEIEGEMDLFELIRILGKRYGDDFYELILDTEKMELKNGVIIGINGKVARRLDEKIRDGDTLVLSIAVGGG
ncbi:MoaD/ThiS family protein [Candidatus Bathyarchaeota archaeon]|nr:MoaD/ThiS family protein [Candidatus Bathyarchaeota archaeon]